MVPCDDLKELDLVLMFNAIATSLFSPYCTYVAKNSRAISAIWTITADCDILYALNSSLPCKLECTEWLEQNRLYEYDTIEEINVDSKAEYTA